MFMPKLALKAERDTFLRLKLPGSSFSFLFFFFCAAHRSGVTEPPRYVLCPPSAARIDPQPTISETKRPFSIENCQRLERTQFHGHGLELELELEETRTRYRVEFMVTVSFVKMEFYRFVNNDFFFV